MRSCTEARLGAFFIPFILKQYCSNTEHGQMSFNAETTKAQEVTTVLFNCFEKERVFVRQTNALPLSMLETGADYGCCYLL